MSDWQEELDKALENDDRPSVLSILSRLPNIPGAIGSLAEDCSRLVFTACQKGYPEILQFLHDYGIIIANTGTQDSPVQVACEHNQIQVLDLLLERNVPILSLGMKAWDDRSPLYIATKLGYMDILHRLIEKDPSLIKSEQVRSSLLYAACLGGHIDMVKMWLTPGVDINHPLEIVKRLEDCEKLTPLYGACSGGHVELIEFLRSNCEELELTSAACNAFPEIIGQALKQYFVSDASDDGSEDGLFELCTGHLQRKNLHVLHELWLTPYFVTLSELNISNNNLTELPSCLPWKFQNLRVLDAHKNKLKHLTYNVTEPGQIQEDEEEPVCSSLQEVNLSQNNLESVCRQLFEIESLRQLNLSHNKLVNLSKSLRHQVDVLLDSVSTLNRHSTVQDREWQCTQLRKLDVSHNALIMLPLDIQGCTSLVHINASNNRLSSFLQPWNCPLEILDLSHNQMERFPVNVEHFWSGSLKFLNISHNLLDELNEGVVRLGVLADLVASNNKIERLPSPELWDCGHLQNLNLKHNRLGIPLESPTKKKFPLPSIVTKKRLNSKSHDDSRILHIPQSLAYCLKELRLADNNLDCVPPSICDLISLEILDLSDNPLIKVLPTEMGKLKNCGMLKLKGVTPTNIKPEYLGGQNNTKVILADLLDLLRKCKPYHKLKAVVLGKKEKGKTTLVDILANRKYNVPPERKSIVRTEVVLRKGFPFFDVKLRRDHDITLNVWDLAGDEVYTQIHHSLFTPLTLYILVWDFWSIKDEIDKIEKWINNIQASTSSYKVVLVGTFIDKTQLKPEMIQETKDLITEQLGECAPKLCPVSCISMEGIENLKNCLYETACSITLPTRGRETVIGRKIPKTYRVMEKLLMQTQCDLEAQGKPLFLTQSQFVEIIEQIPPPNDLLSAEEVTNVTKFLVEVGHLLHFSDPLGALDTLYFLDPAWLCDILLHVLISPEGKKLLKQGRGRIHREAAKKLYEECTRFPSMFIDQYLELLERFEIATSISQSEFLFFPCQLPIDPPIIDTAEDKLDEGICLRRLYRMAECPSGFWMRLVSRMMMRVDQFAKRDWHFRPMATHSVRAFTIRHGSSQSKEPNRCGSYHGLQIKTAKKTFCRELIHVSHEDGSFCVEPAIFSGLEKKSSLQNGVLITEVSKTGNFGIMGIIVDEIEDIIQDFYPGLLEPDMLLLSNRLERYALCSACYQGLPLPTHVYHFTMEHCARLLISGENIICPRGIKQDVNMLVPDLLLKELPEKYFMDVNKLELAESKNSCLGVGVTGSVFKAKYDGRPVAVKVYRSDIRNVPAGNFVSIGSTSSDSGTATLSTQGSVVEEDVYVNIADTKLLDMNETASIKALKALKEMRQEVGITSRLHHPCVISLIGLAFRPKLLMALELAPLGSLRDILDKKTQGRPVFNRYRDKDALFQPLFDKELIFKFVYQIAKGLEYLHSNGIIYKDLKSDNILAMSDELSAPVNLKLSDYGISKYCWSGRSVGLVGTPGYQAPEILDGKAYDEKVDIFAFAMVIYEILTGRRPYSEYENLAQITKAMKTEGKRPNTKDYNVMSKFPYIEVMMRECWENNVFSRPSATEMVSKHKMQNLQFLAQSWAVDLRNQKLGVNCVLGPAVTESENKALLCIWDVRESGRSFYILDPEWTTIPVLAQEYEGAQVQCMAKVGKHIWVGNADKTVQVFTRSDAGTLDEVGSFQLNGVPVQILAVKDKTARITHDSYSVYIALDQGHMLLFKTIYSGSRVPAVPRRHTVRNISGYTDPTYIVLRSRTTYCMAYAESKHEIWVSSNKYIDIVSCAHFKVNSDERVNMKILLPICGISPSFIVSQMVCVGSQMFCMLAFSPFILDFDTNSYHCQSVLNLESPKLLGLIVTKDITFTEADHEAYCGDISKEAQYTQDRESLEVTDSEEEDDAPAIPPRPITRHRVAFKGQDISDSKLIPQKFHKVLGINPGEEDQDERKPKPPPRPSRRLSDVNSMESGRRTPPLPPRAGTLDNTQRPTVYNKRPSKSLPNFTKSAEFEIDITSILIVKDCLWVGRSCGDICIVNIDRANPVGYSKVVADMYDLNSKFRAGKTIQGVQLVKTGDNIAAAYKLSDGTQSEVQIAFWDSYGVQDVRRVDKYWGNILAIEKDLLPDNADNSF